MACRVDLAVGLQQASFRPEWGGRLMARRTFDVVDVTEILIHWYAGPGLLVCHGRREELKCRRVSLMRCCARDDGRPFEVTLRGGASNHRVLH